MPCLLNTDQPLRVQTAKGGVIHAGDYHHFHGRHIWRSGRKGEYIEPHEGVRIACSWKEVPKSKVVDNRNAITCKNCMKKMGMDESAVFPDRYVIRRKDTGEFFKNTRSRCSMWSKDLSDAWFYKRKGDTKKRINRVRYVDDAGMEHSCGYYVAKQKGYRRIEYADPNLEVKKVKITLED